MTLMKSKPSWHKGEIIATERGWVNPKNNEVLVAIGNLKKRLEEEGIYLDTEEVTDEMLAAKTKVVAPVVTPVPGSVKRTPKAKKNKDATPENTQPEEETPVENAEKKIIGEVTEDSVTLTEGKKIIAEVVEDSVVLDDKKLIGE